MADLRQDIVGEHAAGNQLAQRHLDRFAAEGVPALYLARTWCGDYSWVNRDRVVFANGGDRFEFERRAKGGRAAGAFTFVVYDEFGRPADIAAWRPPALALWLGQVAMLGQELALASRLGDPLPVYNRVIDWFRAARDGVYITDFAQAAHVLRNDTLGVKTDEHARFLRKSLATPAPHIRVERRQDVVFARESAAA